MNALWRHRLWLALPGLVLAVLVAMLALESPGGDRLVNALIGSIGLILVWGAAVAVQVRFPERPLGRLLFLLALFYGLTTLINSQHSLLFTLARLARAPMEVLLIWIMVAFPSGRLAGWRRKMLVGASVFAFVALWLPSVMLSSGPAMLGPLITCQADCPQNLVQIADRPELARNFSLAFRVFGLIILVTTVVLLAERLRVATPLMRRVLAPVLLTSIARALALAVFLVVDLNRFVMALSFCVIPLSIALGLLLGRLYTARALQMLVKGLRGRPDVHQLHEVMSSALGDRSLKIAYWIKEGARWVNDEGAPVVLPEDGRSRKRAVTLVHDGRGERVAALEHDVALLEEPSLIEAVSGSLLVLLESQRLDAELRASHTRTVSAVEAERRRIERDLHDGAQQRLIAVRMKLGIMQRLMDHDADKAKALMHELGTDVDLAIRELRDYAHGVMPPLLAEGGLTLALKELARRAAIPIQTRIDDVGRCSPATEAAVYFCCLEALQNSAKHAGPSGTTSLSLRREGQTILLTCVDDGPPVSEAAAGSPQSRLEGQGLRNMRERIEAIGGKIQAGPGDTGRFQVRAEVPADI